MTSKSKANKEQEAIDSITLLMRHIESEQGIQELTDNVMARGREIMESQLKKAREEVRKIETKMKFLDGDFGSIEPESKKTKKPDHYVKSRPEFSTTKLAKEIETGFLPLIGPGKEFMSHDVRDYISDAWGVSEEDREYLTENGSNIFTANVRKTLGNLVQKGKIKRIKPGLFSTKQLKSEGANGGWKETLVWEGSESANAN